MRYLIFTGGEKNPLFDILFSDLKDRQDVVMEAALPKLPDSSLYRLFHARTFNKKHPAPFRSAWDRLAEPFEKTIEKELEKDKELWLIFNNFSVSFFEPSALNRWKKKYGVKLCLYFLDRADSYYAAEAKLYTGCVDFDTILTYHRPDEKDYGFRYFDCYYSRQEPELSENRSDIFFWGSDGNRRGIVEEIYRKVTGMGLSADFGICYPLGEGRQEGIIYDKELSYTEILKRTAASDVILDVVRPDSLGVSLRYFEAVVYGKKLITNNPLVRDMRSFDPERMLVIEKAEDIGREFFEKDTVSREYAGEFSPVHFPEMLV